MDVIGGLAPLSIPGVSPLVATGPLLVGLGGTAAGAVDGGVAGGLVGLGMPEFEARIYDGKLRTGSILLSVNAPNGDRLRRATALFQQAGAYNAAGWADNGLDPQMAFEICPESTGDHTLTVILWDGSEQRYVVTIFVHCLLYTSPSPRD